MQAESPSTTNARASHIAASAAWGRRVDGVDDALLAAALAVARENRVERAVVEAHPGRLGPELARLDGDRASFRDALAASGAALEAAAVPACLIKVDPDDDLGYENFDVVVPLEDWPEALGALAGWADGTSRHRLERDKRFVHNPHGPDLHLHSRVSWYEVPVIDAAPLLARAATAIPGFGVPAPADRLRTLLAHAAFQTLCLDLRDLRDLRELLDAGVVDEARPLARSEGWAGLFEHALAVGRAAVGELDAGRTPRLPAPLSGHVALARGGRHVAYLARRRPRAALRELALRPALVAAKLRRGIATW